MTKDTIHITENGKTDKDAMERVMQEIAAPEQTKPAPTDTKLFVTNRAEEYDNYHLRAQLENAKQIIATLKAKLAKAHDDVQTLTREIARRCAHTDMLLDYQVASTEAIQEKDAVIVKYETVVPGLKQVKDKPLSALKPQS